MAIHGYEYARQRRQYRAISPRVIVLLTTVAIVSSVIGAVPSVLDAYAVMSREQAEQNYREAVPAYLEETYQAMTVNKLRNFTVLEQFELAAVEYYAYLNPEELRHEQRALTMTLEQRYIDEHTQTYEEIQEEIEQAQFQATHLPQPKQPIPERITTEQFMQQYNEGMNP